MTDVNQWVSEWSLVKCDDLEINRFQARKENVGDGLDDLAFSIEKHGLLHPIIIAKSEDNPDKWEIVAGQRRFLAVSGELQLTEIMAGKILRPISEAEGLAISAAENVIRSKMTTKDLIDVCVRLYRQYGSLQMVSKETALPLAIVRTYVKYEALPDELRVLVDNHELNQTVAQKIQTAATNSVGAYDVIRGEELLTTLKQVDNKLGSDLLRVITKNPRMSVQEATDRAEKADKAFKISLNLLPKQAQALREFADDNDEAVGDSAAKMILGTLESEGYLSDDGDGEEE